MSHAAPVLTTRLIDRATEASRYLAPKLIAFLATGLTSSILIGVLASFGVAIEPTLAAIIVGALSTVAAYIQRDNLLALAPGQFSLKVIAFIVSSVTVTGIAAAAEQFGIDLTPHSALIGLILTALGSLVGYAKADRVIVDVRDADGVPDVSSLENPSTFN